MEPVIRNPHARRRRLRELSLTGARAAWRKGLVIALAGFAVLGVIGGPLPAHRMESDHGGDVHYGLNEGGLVAMMCFAVVAVVAWTSRRGGFGRAWIAATVSLVASVVTGFVILLSHLLTNVERLVGDELIATSILGQLIIGPVLLVIEPFLFLRERTLLERSDPVFPTARAIRR